MLDYALAPDPAARYKNVAEFGNEVMQVAASTPDLDQTVRVSTGALGVGEGAGVPTTAAKPRGSTAPVGAGYTMVQGEGGKRRSVALIATVLVTFAAVAGASYVAVQYFSSAPVPVHHDSTVVTVADTVAPRTDPTMAPVQDTKAQVALVPKKTAPPAPNVDSIAAVQRVEAVHADSVARADSTARADSIARAVRAPVTARMPIRAQHPWMKANGDSGASTPNAGFQAAVTDIQGHLQRAGQMITAGQLQRVPPEFRDAQSELKVLHDVMPQAPAVIGLRDAAAPALRGQAFSACTAAAQNDSTAKLRCRVFQPQNPNGRAGRAAPPPTSFR